jgi:lipopolysaccharide export system permease protein
MAGSASMALCVTVFALMMETMPRLIARISLLGNGFYFVSQSLVSLIPEYLGIAVPLAIYLATTLAFRRLALSNELDVLAASGMGWTRLLRMPIALALAGCILSLALSGFIQPAGERRLDGLGTTAATGGLGVALPERVPNIIDRNTQLYFDCMSPAGLDNVFLQQGTTFVSAQTASLARGAAGDLILNLHDGVMTGTMDGKVHTSHFTRLRWDVPFESANRPHWKPARDRLQRFDIHALLTATASRRTGLPQAVATASASGRCASALFVLLLPLFGFALGVPPKRSRSGLAAGFGILLILLFWRASALIEDHFAWAALQLHALLLIAFAGFGAGLFRLETRYGPGIVEQLLLRLVNRVRKLLPALPHPRRTLIANTR